MIVKTEFAVEKLGHNTGRKIEKYFNVNNHY